MSAGASRQPPEVYALPRHVGDTEWSDAWQVARPTLFPDETCQDFLMSIEKGLHEPALLQHLEGLMAVLPDAHCEILRIPTGSTYADAVRALEPTESR